VREGEGEGKGDLRDEEFQGDGNGSHGRSKIRERLVVRFYLCFVKN
jgi:hypothetical protein